MKYLHDTAPLNTPLWCVYGYKYGLSIMSCMINQPWGKKTIWGYSVYKRVPGYRTLGVDVEQWSAGNKITIYFDDQEEALDYLRKSTKPHKTAQQG